MLGLGVAVAIIVFLLLAVAVFSRARPAAWKEILWIGGGGLVLPLAVLIPLYLATVVTSSALTRPAEPHSNLAVEVTGHMWWWEVTYPDHGVVTANEIHIPAGRPVLVRLRSDDVIHSFWVPRLHGKVDLNPGSWNELRIEADEPGVYRGQCAEYCGLQHARMAFLVVAESPEDFDRWIAARSRPAPDPATAPTERGLHVFMEAGCAACHAIAGTEASGREGPDLTHLASRRTLAAGQLPNTTGALGGWIVDPQATKPGALMPPSRLEPGDLQALLAYMGTLR